MDEQSAQRLNLKAVQALRDLAEPGEEDPLAEFVELFFSDAPVRVQEMCRASAAQNAAKLKAAAHALKGSSSNVGAERLALLCNQIESGCASPDWAALQKLTESSEAELAYVQTALQAEVSRQKE